MYPEGFVQNVNFSMNPWVIWKAKISVVFPDGKTEEETWKARTCPRRRETGHTGPAALRGSGRGRCEARKEGGRGKCQIWVTKGHVQFRLSLNGSQRRRMGAPGLWFRKLSQEWFKAPETAYWLSQTLRQELRDTLRSWDAEGGAEMDNGGSGTRTMSTGSADCVRGTVPCAAARRVKGVQGFPNQCV